MQERLIGIQVEPARQLALEVRRWAGDVDEIIGLVAEAERLADLATGTIGPLDDLGRTGRSLGLAITRAVDDLVDHRMNLATLSSFELDVIAPQWSIGGGVDAVSDAAAVASTQHDAVDEADALLAHVAAATHDGRPPDPAHFDRLQAIFDAWIDDPDAAALALGWALGGVSAQTALGLGSVAEIDQTFAHVALAIEQGRHPDQVPVPVELFPPLYVEWHDLQRSIEQLESEWAHLVWRHYEFSDELARIEAELNELRAEQLRAGELIGLAGEVLRLAPDGSATAFIAGSVVAAHLGRPSLGALGAYLGSGGPDRFGVDGLALAKLLASEPTAAVAYFNELGPVGTASLPLAWSTWTLQEQGPGHSHDVLGLFAAALASASGHDELQFSGGDLIRAEVPVDVEWLSVQPNGVAEILLVAPGFDRQFLLDAAVASFDRPPPVTLPAPIDDARHAVALALVTNELSADFVIELDRADRLGLLLAPEAVTIYAAQGDGADFGPVPPLVEQAVGEWLPIHLLLLQVGQSDAAVGAVIDFLANAPTRHESLTDVGLIRGVGALMTVAMASYVFAGGSQDDFAKAYDVLLQSGGGNEVALVAANTLMADVVTQQLQAGRPVALDDAGSLIGQIEAARYAAHLADAELADAAAANLRLLLGLLSTGSGAAGLGLTFSTGPVGTVVGVLTGLFGLALSIFGLSGADETEVEQFLSGELGDALLRPHGIVQQVLIGALASGHVVDADGEPVELVPVQTAGPAAFMVIDAAGVVRYQGDFGADGPDELILPTPNGDEPWFGGAFDDLFVDGVPLQDLVTGQLAIIVEINAHQYEAFAATGAD